MKAKGPLPQGGNLPYSLEALELFRLFPEAKPHFKLSTAVRMSATFPYFTPAVSLPTSPRRRVVDAGYYDNYGVGLAASWLFSSRSAAWIGEHASKIVLVQIRDSVSDPDRCLEQVPEGGTGVISRALEEASSPPEGMYNGVFGAASFRNDGQLELLSAYFRADRARRAAARFDREVGLLLEKPEQATELRRKIEGHVLRWQKEVGTKKVEKQPRLWERIKPDLEKHFAFKDRGAAAVETPWLAWMRTFFQDLGGMPRPPQRQRYFTTVTFECGGRAALNWYLSRADRKRIEAAMRSEKTPPGATDVPETTQAFLEWWKEANVEG
jgi:hypothetical protein